MIAFLRSLSSILIFWIISLKICVNLHNILNLITSLVNPLIFHNLLQRESVFGFLLQNGLNQFPETITLALAEPDPTLLYAPDQLLQSFTLEGNFQKGHAEHGDTEGPYVCRYWVVGLPLREWDYFRRHEVVSARAWKGFCVRADEVGCSEVHDFYKTWGIAKDILRL